ncbi:MAG: nitrate reductase molybdenum cofactor assembly chaperone [Brooklawnia sp.]|nr:nitrate reductase molybdenum cofactor assembly chaperone [Brooklawnia sp.]
MSVPLYGRGSFLGRPRQSPLAPVPHTARQRALTHMAASILLDYPTTENLAKYPVVAGALAELPAPIASRLRGYLDHAEQVGPDQLSQEYVTTFDLKRKCTLYLSYFLTGDTRKRGMALVSFVEAYRAAGFELDANELPDYLPVVLEFSAVGDAELAGVLLSSNREGLEVLREALGSTASPWGQVVEAVTCTLPHVSGAVRERVLDIISGGPPIEMVGLDGRGQQQTELTSVSVGGERR